MTRMTHSHWAQESLSEAQTARQASLATPEPAPPAPAGSNKTLAVRPRRASLPAPSSKPVRTTRRASLPETESAARRSRRPALRDTHRNGAPQKRSRKGSAKVERLPVWNCKSCFHLANKSYWCTGCGKPNPDSLHPQRTASPGPREEIRSRPNLPVASQLLFHLVPSPPEAAAAQNSRWFRNKVLQQRTKVLPAQNSCWFRKKVLQQRTKVLQEQQLTRVPFPDLLKVHERGVVNDLSIVQFSGIPAQLPALSTSAAAS